MQERLSLNCDKPEQGDGPINGQLNHQLAN
jgi:hypothetical protein